MHVLCFLASFADGAWSGTTHTRAFDRRPSCRAPVMQRCSITVSGAGCSHVYTHTHTMHTQCTAVLAPRFLYSHCSARPIVRTTILLLSSLQSLRRLIVANYRLRSVLRLLGLPAWCKGAHRNHRWQCSRQRKKHDPHVHTESQIGLYVCTTCCMTVVGSF